jgi:hypothetical protein
VATDLHRAVISFLQWYDATLYHSRTPSSAAVRSWYACEGQGPTARDHRAHNDTVAAQAYQNAPPGDTCLAISARTAHAMSVLSGRQGSSETPSPKTDADGGEPMRKSRNRHRRTEADGDGWDGGALENRQFTICQRHR